MTTRQYLKQLKKFDTVIAQKKNELQKNRKCADAIRSIDISREHIDGGRIVNNARFVDTLAQIDELENEIVDEINRYVKYQHNIINQIQELPNALHIEILYKHYVEYKRLETISAEMNYSYQYILELHGAALKKFSETYKI